MNEITDNILVYSSLLFLTNFAHSRSRCYNNYSTWFYLLTVTSLLMHGFFPGNIYMNLIDKIPTVGIVVTGGYYALEKTQRLSVLNKVVYSSLIISSFISTVYLFYYGYYTNSFCYDEDINIAKNYHALLHLISCAGHHVIIFM
jgi:hypothetical protein